VSSPNEQENFAGLMPLVRQYVASINVDLETRVVIDKYLDLVSKRASGTLSLSPLGRLFVIIYASFIIPIISYY
jgi:hypothetical protein